MVNIIYSRYLPILDVFVNAPARFIAIDDGVSMAEGLTDGGGVEVRLRPAIDDITPLESVLLFIHRDTKHLLESSCVVKRECA